MRKFIFIALSLLLLSFVFQKDESFDQMALKNGRGKAPFAKYEHVQKWEKEKKKIVFLDTREKNEFNVSHLKNAVWIGYDNFKLDDAKKQISNADVVVCYCSVGYRSAKIADRLINAKVSPKVYNLYGGIFYWVNNGHDVFTNENVKTNKVHAYSQKWGKWLVKGVKVYE